MIASRISLISVAASWVFICALLSPLEAQSNDDEAATLECMDRRREIAKELTGPKTTPWMGEYHAYMTSFALAPTAGFSLSRGSHVVGNSSCAWGRVEWSDGKIRLIPDPATPIGGTRGLDLEWLPVVWGDRHYLIAANDLLRFVNSVNIGYEPSFHFLGMPSFYKLLGDADRKVVGFPDVPAPYQDYLLSKPIRAKITGVGPFETETEDNGKVQIRVTKVTIDAGAKHGVKVGMNFLTYEPRRVHEHIEITKVYDVKSDAVIRQRGTNYDTPSKKWKLSTSRRDIK